MPIGMEWETSKKETFFEDFKESSERAAQVEKRPGGKQ